MPHLGDNAIYKIAPAIAAIEKLNDRLKDDAFLGKGTCTISWIGCKTPSLCAVPAEAEFHIDRRLTVGETRESALAEVEAAMKEAGVEAEVFTLTYREKAWTGLEYPMDKYYPTWVLAEDASGAAGGAARVHRHVPAGRPRSPAGTSAPTAWPSWACTGSRAWASGPAARKWPTPPTNTCRSTTSWPACAFYAALPGELLAG